MNNWTAENIRCLRLRFGWSAADFSRQFGCLASDTMAWEKGEKSPSPDDILQLERLHFYQESCCEVLQRQPIAEFALKDFGLEQVHQEHLEKLNKQK